jgi:hypothetical protein
MNFGIKKYSQVCNRVDQDYSGHTEFIMIDQYVGFAGEGYGFRFAEEFHLVACRTFVRRRLKSGRC